MTNYLISSGYNENGGNIALNAPWEHQKSELRCLAIVTDKEHQELKVLNGDLILGSNGTYTITYPFETPGLPWAAYLWRETTQNGNPKYENGRIPVEAMLSKLSELSKKADETREFVKRAFMTPEDAEGKMFVPPLEVRKGRLLGFDNNGNPVTGDACPQIAELDEQQKAIEGLAKDARDRALEAANSVILAAEYATNALNSANNAGRSAVSAGNYATDAKNWHDKTVSESAITLAKSELAAGRSELAERLARESAVRAEQAMNEALLGLSDLNEKLCYVSCAVGRAEKAVETVESKAEEAKVELSEKAEQTKQEIGAFTDVYKKTETYSKAQIDGVDTGAELTLKMNEIHAQLKDWEEITGVNLPLDFYGQLMEEFQKWQENPVRKNWNTTSATESNNPFNSSATSKPIIAWNLECKGQVSYPSFSADILGLVFLSGVGSAYCAMVKSKNSSFVYCDSEDCFGFVRNSSGSPTLYLPNATTISQIAAYTGKPTVYAPKAKNFRQAFYNNSGYNIAVALPSGEDGAGAFTNSGMSAENISKTLDSLPTWTDGVSHVITFTGSPGAKELTQESPSVAAAVARGWTVEL